MTDSPPVAFDKIVKNLSAIQFHAGNIASFRSDSLYSKMYFSNVLGDGTGFGLQSLKNIAEYLEFSGLMYFASSGMVRGLICDNGQRDWPQELRQDMTQTRIAQANEFIWTPLVCRKVPLDEIEQWPTVFHYC